MKALGILYSRGILLRKKQNKTKTNKQKKNQHCRGFRLSDKTHASFLFPGCWPLFLTSGPSSLFPPLHMNQRRTIWEKILNGPLFSSPTYISGSSFPLKIFSDKVTSFLLLCFSWEGKTWSLNMDSYQTQYLKGGIFPSPCLHSQRIFFFFLTCLYFLTSTFQFNKHALCTSTHHILCSFLGIERWIGYMGSARKCFPFNLSMAGWTHQVHIGYGRLCFQGWS